MQRFGLSSHQYADDTQLCFMLPEDPRKAVETMNGCLKAVLGAMRANNLKFKHNKMVVLLVGGGSDQ